MPVQKRLSQISFAKQAGKGTSAANGTYQIGVTSGNVVKADVAEDDLPVTWATRTLEGHDRTGIVPGVEFDAVALPKSIGLLLYAACGTVSTTGTDPYQHAITPGTDLPYLTFFATMGTEFYRVKDAKVSSLELSWDQVGALRASVSAIGTSISFQGSADTPGATERVADGVLKGQGGVFTIDSVAATIKSGSISIDNSVEAVFGSGSVEPADVFPALHTVGVSLTVIPDDLTLFRRVITGTAAGTSAQAIPEYGTAQMKFLLNANTYIDFVVSNMRFLSDFPSADGSGGPVEVTLEGSVSVPAGGGSPYTFTVSNNVTSY